MAYTVFEFKKKSFSTLRFESFSVELALLLLIRFFLIIFEIEFFKNDVSQGIAFTNLSTTGSIYPAISCTSKGARIRLLNVKVFYLHV